MYYLFGIIYFILLITSPLLASDDAQHLETRPRSQSLCRATRQRERYAAPPGKRVCQKLLTALQIPPRHVCSGQPTSGAPARCQMPGGAGETSCPPVACLTGAEETGRALTLLLPPSPLCSHSPTSPHEEAVNITSLCQGHQPGPRCPSTHGPTKQSTLTLPGRTASEEHLRGKWPPPEQRGSFSRSRYTAEGRAAPILQLRK